MKYVLKYLKNYNRVYGESTEWFYQLNQLSKARHLSFLAFRNKKKEKNLRIKNQNGFYEK